MLLYLSGCRFIDLNWNGIRIGTYEREEQVLGDSYIIRESTVGFKFNWAPDDDQLELNLIKQK